MYIHNNIHAYVHVEDYNTISVTCTSLNCQYSVTFIMGTPSNSGFRKMKCMVSKYNNIIIEMIYVSAQLSFDDMAHSQCIKATGCMYCTCNGGFRYAHILYYIVK